MRTITVGRGAKRRTIVTFGPKGMFGGKGNWTDEAKDPRFHDPSYLHPDLDEYVIRGSDGRWGVRSPLIVDLLAPIVPDINFRYLLKRKLLKQALAAKDWSAAQMWTERPFRLSELLRWHREGLMSNAEFLQEFPGTWSDAEPDDTDPRWLEVYQWLTRLNGGKRLEVKGEDGKLVRLPKGELLTVYRGQFDDKKSSRGCAWTLEPKVAEMFAKRYNPNPSGVVIVGTVGRGDVLCYNDTRSEKEVNCDFRDVKVERTYRVDLTEGFGMANDPVAGIKQALNNDQTWSN
jgi:hypothetical protein